MKDEYSIAVAARHAVLPLIYGRARQALSECARLDECKDWADKAAALAVYAAQANDEQLMNDAKRIKARAVDRMGELAEAIPTKPGKRTDLEPGGGMSPRLEAATKAGLSPDQLKDAIRVHNVPRDVFERLVEGNNPPTISFLARQGTRHLGEGTTIRVTPEYREPEVTTVSVCTKGTAADRELAAWLIDHAGSSELPRLAELFENCNADVVGSLLRGKCKQSA
jgi:hypothetical protein